LYPRKAWVYQEIDNRKFGRDLLDGFEAAGIPKESVEEALHLLTNAGSDVGLPSGGLPPPRA